MVDARLHPADVIAMMKRMLGGLSEDVCSAAVCALGGFFVCACAAVASTGGVPKTAPAASPPRMERKQLRMFVVLSLKKGHFFESSLQAGRTTRPELLYITRVTREARHCDRSIFQPSGAVPRDCAVLE
jgi:hypothetical protein